MNNYYALILISSFLFSSSSCQLNNFSRQMNKQQIALARQNLDKIINSKNIITPQNKILYLAIEENRGNYVSRIEIWIDGEIICYFTEETMNYYLERLTRKAPPKLVNEILEALKYNTFSSKLSNVKSGDYKSLIITPDIPKNSKNNKIGVVSIDWNQLDKNENLKKLKAIIIKNKLDKWIWNDYVKKYDSSRK